MEIALTADIISRYNHLYKNWSLTNMQQSLSAAARSVGSVLIFLPMLGCIIFSLIRWNRESASAGRSDENRDGQ